MSDMDLYIRYFPVGKKVGVGIPLPNAEVFRDWAIIHDIDEDLVSLQLSRDDLPAEVSLHYGQILELRGGTENNGYSCRAIVVSEGDARELLLRLIGEIVSDELREFYRIDAFLPIKYFVSKEQHIDRLHKEWEERRIVRLQREFERKDQRWDGTHPANAELPRERRLETGETADEAAVEDAVETAGEPVVYGPAEVAAHDRAEEERKERESWETIVPLAANVSGGGLRIVTHQEFEDGEYVLLEILLPLPQRVIDVVGRIVFANRNYAAGSDYAYYNTGVQFVYIDERDRDAIVTYISTIQLKRIRQLRERYLYRGMLEGESQPGAFGVKITVLSAVLFLILMAFLINYFWRYSVERPKGEIERTFEEGVEKYRDRFK